MKIVFTGNFWEYFIISFLLAISVVGLIYLPYWSMKYFVTHLEIKNN